VPNNLLLNGGKLFADTDTQNVPTGAEPQIPPLNAWLLNVLYLIDHMHNLGSLWGEWDVRCLRCCYGRVYLTTLWAKWEFKRTRNINLLAEIQPQ